MSTGHSFWAFVCVIALAINVGVQSWGFAALSAGFLLLYITEAICDAIKGAKP